MLPTITTDTDPTPRRDHALVIAPVGIFQTDTDGARTFVNDRWCELAGMRRDRALGEGWLAAVHPDDRARVENEWSTAVDERRDFALEYRFLRPDGTVVWVAATASATRTFRRAPATSGP